MSKYHNNRRRMLLDRCREMGVTVPAGEESEVYSSLLHNGQRYWVLTHDEHDLSEWRAVSADDADDALLCTISFTVSGSMTVLAGSEDVLAEWVEDCDERDILDEALVFGDVELDINDIELSDTAFVADGEDSYFFEI